MRYYTIVNSDDFIKKEEFTWGNLFDALDSTISSLGYNITSGKYAPVNPYGSRPDFTRIEIPGFPALDSGQLIELTPVSSLWGL